VFYLIIGIFSLISYMKIGYDHRANYGEKYIPQMELKNEN